MRHADNSHWSNNTKTDWWWRMTTEIHLKWYTRTLCVKNCIPRTYFNNWLGKHPRNIIKNRWFLVSNYDSSIQSRAFHQNQYRSQNANSVTELKTASMGHVLYTIMLVHLIFWIHISWEFLVLWGVISGPKWLLCHHKTSIRLYISQKYQERHIKSTHSPPYHSLLILHSFVYLSTRQKLYSGQKVTHEANLPS